MQIFEQRVFRFEFQFLGNVATFNVVAESQHEAAGKIIEWMGQTMTELSMSFPKFAPESDKKEKPKDMQALRIETLVGDIVSKGWLAMHGATPETVKEWLNMEYEPNNFPLIVDGLEKLKSAYENGKIKKNGK